LQDPGWIENAEASGRVPSRTEFHRATASKINTGNLITRTTPLDKISDAFDLMHEGKSIRSVVIY